MKKILILFTLLSIILLGCKKEESIQPDRTASPAHPTPPNYQLSSYLSGHSLVGDTVIGIFMDDGTTDSISMAADSFKINPFTNGNQFYFDYWSDKDDPFVQSFLGKTSGDTLRIFEITNPSVEITRWVFRKQGGQYNRIIDLPDGEEIIITKRI